MAMVILSLMPDAHRYDVKVLASDIDANMLAEASNGVYAENFAEDAPAKMRHRWLSPTAEGPRGERGRYVAVADELRDLVAFRELNSSATGRCAGRSRRSSAVTSRSISRRRRSANCGAASCRCWRPGGRLYIGHSERLTGAAASAFDSEGVTCYRLKEDVRA